MKRLLRTCKECSKDFYEYYSRILDGRGKYCSKSCSNKYTLFKKGELHGVQYKKGTNSHFCLRIGEKNEMWKGDRVGYVALHEWVTKQLGRPNFCEHCESKTASKYHWANKSLNYKRDINDWIRLCVSCHRKYDHKMGWGVASLKFPVIAK